MSDEVVNLPVSVLHRLRNKARAEGRNPQELLRYYAIERFLYRLAQSVYAEKFVLKGALIFLAWGLDLARPTRDIDLAGFAPVNVETISRVMKDVCRTAVIADGMAYDAESVRGVIIRMKDFYDVWLITRRLEFEGGALQQAIQATFHRRQTSMPTQLPPAFTDDFASNKQPMWSAFVARNMPVLDAPLDFHAVVVALREFAAPLFASSIVYSKWSPDRGWH